MRLSLLSVCSRLIIGISVVLCPIWQEQLQLQCISSYLRLRVLLFANLFKVFIPAALCIAQSTGFWPTVLSVVPLARCVVCLSVCLSSSSVCDVLYCGKTVRPSEKVSEGVNRKSRSKSWFWGLPPYFYFRFRRYSHQDGRFCLILLV